MMMMICDNLLDCALGRNDFGLVAFFFFISIRLRCPCFSNKAHHLIRFHLTFIVFTWENCQVDQKIWLRSALSHIENIFQIGLFCGFDFVSAMPVSLFLVLIRLHCVCVFFVYRWCYSCIGFKLVRRYWHQSQQMKKQRTMYYLDWCAQRSNHHSCYSVLLNIKVS